jgi:glycosyltransferase involved in cell wall biosynthesis
VTAPEISFILPAYQPRASWLSEAVTSVLVQRGPEIEVILVDDGSPEPVAELLGERDPRLQIIRVGHAGVSAARNAGIGAARGTWLRFLDDDDVVPAESNLGLLCGVKDSAQIVVGSTQYCGEDLMPAHVGQAGAHDDLAVACLRGRVDTHIGAMLIHRDVIASAGLFDIELDVMEDFDFAIRMFAAAETRVIQDVVYRYRRHYSSATGRASADDAEKAWQRVIGRFFEHHPELDSSSLRRELRALRALDAAGAHAASGNAFKALSSLFSAAGNAPARCIKALPRLLAQLSLASRRGLVA